MPGVVKVLHAAFGCAHVGVGGVGKVTAKFFRWERDIGPTSMTGQIIDGATNRTVVGVVGLTFGMVLGFEGIVGDHGAVDGVGRNLEAFGETFDHFGLGKLDAEFVPVDLQAEEVLGPTQIFNLPGRAKGFHFIHIFYKM